METQITQTQIAQIAEALEAYFKDNEDNAVRVCEEQELFNEDDRWFEMELLDEIYADEKPLELLRRVFYGYDADTSDPDNGKYLEFNPNRDYFRYNGYGNLVSSDYKDYSDYISNAVDFILNNPSEYEAEFDSEFDEIIEPLLKEQNDEIMAIINGGE